MRALLVTVFVLAGCQQSRGMCEIKMTENVIAFDGDCVCYGHYLSCVKKNYSMYAVRSWVCGIEHERP